MPLEKAFLPSMLIENVINSVLTPVQRKRNNTVPDEPKVKIDHLKEAVPSDIESASEFNIEWALSGTRCGNPLPSKRTGFQCPPVHARLGFASLAFNFLWNHSGPRSGDAAMIWHPCCILQTATGGVCI
jgi:hypothetical protein